MNGDVTYLAALIAGIVSFLSPCVLPLVPPYLVFLAGTSLERFADKEPEPRVKRETVVAALLFVLGFSTVFVALGASASVFGSLIRAYSGPLATIAGVAIIVMGLHFLGLTQIALLHRQKRIHVAKPVGLWGAYVMGLAFAFAIEPIAAFLSHFRKYLRRVEQAMGALLVLTGIAFLTGSINQMSVWLLEAFPVLGRIG